MYKTLTLALVLLASAAWLQAQAGYGQSGMSQTTTGQTTVEGCLQGSDGNYMLTASNGTMYQLRGDTSKLSEHVGHEVKVTGTTSAASASSSPSSSGSAMTPSGSQQTLTVASVKHVAKTCKSSMAK